MDQESIKVEAAGGLEKDILPRPPRKHILQQKALLVKPLARSA
jgi:hypothetical protein